METGTKIIIGVVLLVIIIFAFIQLTGKSNCKNIVCNPRRPGVDTNGNVSKCCGKLSPSNGGNNNGNTNNNGNGVPPIIPSVPSLNDYVGQWMKAPYDGVKIYYNSDLSEAKSFKKGETMGWLGEEEKGNWICPNRDGFYKVNGTGTLTATCDIIISDSIAKAIFGIK